MSSHVLQIDRNVQEMSWGFIPDSLWKTILRKFAKHKANEIGFAGITDIKGISRIVGFRDTQPEIKYKCELQTVNSNHSNSSAVESHQLAVLPYTSDVAEVVESADFAEWSATDDDYPVDYIYFLHDQQVVLKAIPYESTIVFNVDDSDFQELIKLDNLIKDNIHEANNTITTITIVE
jgi:hypothetical protein